MKGKVYIAGVGSGDEGLITLRAMECLKKADVIVYDRLANSKFLNYAKASAEKIDVGKRANKHTMPQEKINELLSLKALEGKNVLRLKGGDPFVFGRGGEEALELIKHNISFEIIPGVSASNGVTAFAGIPLTHRGISSSFHVITGHEDPTKNEKAINYEVIARLTGTLVFFMGLNNLESICENLIKYGKDKTTPVAIISNGTLQNQKTVCGTLEDINSRRAEMEAPALIVVGEVVSLRDKFNWFENKAEKKVLITRSKEQAKKLEIAVEEIGCSAVKMPMIEIKDNLYKEEVKNIYENISDYKWLIFTSENAVNIFMQGLIENSKDIRILYKTKIAVVGSATKAALSKYYLKADIMPKEFEAEKLALELREKVKKEDKVLFLTSNLAHNSIQKTIEEIGAKIHTKFIYEVATPSYEKGQLTEALFKVNIITFTSPSCVKGFMKVLKEENCDKSILKNKEIVCIGPITAKALKEVGINKFTCAKTHNVSGIAKAISEI